MLHGTVDVVLLILAAVAFAVAVTIPNPPHVIAAYRGRVVALGLLLTVVAVLLSAAKVVN